MRAFLTLAAALAVVPCCRQAVAAEPAVSPGQYRAFWADAFHAGFRSPAEVDKMIEDLVTAKANAIFIEARHRGAVYYLKSNEPPWEDAAYQPGFDAIQYTIEKAHARGIEVHFWSPVTPLWTSSRPPSDPRHLWNTHGPGTKGDDMWMTVNAAGKVSSSLDLGHPAAARYMADVFVDIVRQYPVDGIHLDYIRYPEDDRYGWNPAAVQRFNRLYARDGSPVDSDPAWGDFRRKQVTDLVRQIYLRSYELNRAAKLSASVITWGSGPATDAEFRTKDAYSRVFQDWPRWLEEGIIDFATPMNYFAETPNKVMLDRWLEFEKDRQYGRAITPGLGIYLNPVPATMDQMQRVLTPSAAGNQVPGIVFYSYASTNTLVNGVPQPPAAQFYKTLGDYFKEPAPVPAMPWKVDPPNGHVLGTLTVDGGPAYLGDGVDVTIQSDTNPGVVRRTLTDSTGFFGSLDLPPDRYFVRLARNGQELFRTVPLGLEAGKVARFDIFLKEADFKVVAPRIVRATQDSGAPGEVIALEVANLDAAAAPASFVPLPRALSGVQVLIDGVAAPLSSVYPGRVEFQLPMAAGMWFDRTSWNLVVRKSGLDSAPFQLPAVKANPVISGVRRTDWGFEVFATGLGLTNPPPPPGAGGSATAPYNVVAGEVTAFVRGEQLKVLWAGLQPYQPYLYQVNVEVPAGLDAAGDLVIKVDGIASLPYRF